MSLDGTLNTPIGKFPKKGVVIAGVGLAGIFVIGWYRSRKNAQDVVASDSTDTTDYSSTDSGYASSDYSGLSYDQYGDPVYSGGGYVPVTPGGVPQGPGSFTNNAQWAQYAEQYMVANNNADPAVVGNAIGKYITGQPVTSDQKQVIEMAIAIALYPPVAGPTGNPPHIVDAPPSSGGGGVSAHNPVTGIHKTFVGFNQVKLVWNQSTGAKSYLVTTSTGSKIISRKTVSGPSADVTGLAKHTTYTIKVWAQPSTDHSTAQITVTTKG